MGAGRGGVFESETVPKGKKVLIFLGGPDVTCNGRFPHFLAC